MVSIVAPDIDLYLSEKLDGNNRFLIHGLDFPDSTRFMLAATSKKDRQTNLNVIMNEETTTKQTTWAAIPLKDIKNTLEWKQTLEDYQQLAEYLYESFGKEDMYLMEEAKVFSNNVYRPKYNPSPHNEAFRRSQIRERKDLEPFDNQPLPLYLKTRFPSAGGGKIIIDFAERPGEIGYMSVSDVETIVALSKYDAGTMMYGQGFGGVVMITTRKNYDREKANKAEVTFYTPLGWQRPVAFYSPNYQLKETQQNTPTDLRTTLLWEPMLTTDENGKAKISFYSADRTTRFRFVVEGIADDGTFVSTTNVLE